MGVCSPPKSLSTRHRSSPTPRPVWDTTCLRPQTDPCYPLLNVVPNASPRYDRHGFRGSFVEANVTVLGSFPSGLEIHQLKSPEVEPSSSSRRDTGEPFGGRARWGHRWKFHDEASRETDTFRTTELGAEWVFVPTNGVAVCAFIWRPETRQVSTDAPKPVLDLSLAPVRVCPAPNHGFG